MPHLLDVPGTIRWIRRDGIENILAGMVRYLESDLLRWEEFEKVPRLASHSPHGVIELMPTSDGSLYSFKYVNGHPHNPARGLQTVTGFGVLADVDNGYPILLSEMTLLTALRTAATSALAARELALPGARVHALIGAVAAEFQALAMRTVLGIDRRRAGPRRGGGGSVAQSVRSASRSAASSIETLEGADVVTTCTADKARAAVLHEQVRHAPQRHRRRLPGKTELDPTILEEARVVVV